TDSKELRIDAKQTPRLLIRRATHHHAVQATDLGHGLIKRKNTAVEHDWEVAMHDFQAVHKRIVEWRHFTIFTRAQSFQPGFARMYDQRTDSGRLDRVSKTKQRFLGILLVYRDPAFDCYRYFDRSFHCSDAIAYQRRLGHEARAEAALLDAIRRTADIKV